MRVKTIIGALLVALSNIPSVASAAEFTVDTSKPVTIFVTGQIKTGDSEKFRQLAQKHPGALVILDSPGGEIAPALAMGAMISKAGMATFVGNKITCASSCALIWLAGKERMLQPGSRIGFHAGYRVEDDVAIEDGSSNALIGSYLTMLGLPLEAVVFATRKSPNELSWIDTSGKQDHGIQYTTIPLTDEQVASDKKTEDDPLVDGATFGSWKTLTSSDQTVFLTFDKSTETAMFLECRNGFACRYGFSLGIGCDAGDSYTAMFTVGGYAPTKADLTCNMSGKIMYVDETKAFDRAIYKETFVRVRIAVENGSFHESRFSLIGMTEAYEAAKAKNLVE